MKDKYDIGDYVVITKELKIIDIDPDADECYLLADGHWYTEDEVT